MPILFIEIFKVCNAGNKTSSLSLVPGNECVNTKEILEQLEIAIKKYKSAKSNEGRETFKLCQELRDLFISNSPTALSKWKQYILEARNEYERLFQELLDTWKYTYYTMTEVQTFQTKLALWSTEYIIQKLGNKYRELSVAELPEGAMPSGWSTYIDNTRICTERAKEHGCGSTVTLFGWMEILRYWKFITPLNDDCKIDQKEDIYLGYDTTSGEGLEKLKSRIHEIFLENRKRIIDGKKTFQTALEVVCQRIQTYCSSVEEFKNYKLNLEFSRHEEITRRILLLCDLTSKRIAEYSRAIEFAQEANIENPVEFVNSFLTSKRIAIPRNIEEEQRKIFSEPQKKCPNCGTLNATNAKVCLGCNKELLITCPECNNTVSSDLPKCSRCGFELGNMRRADTKIEKALEMLQQDRLSECEQLLNEVECLWSKHPKLQTMRTSLKEAISEQNGQIVSEYFQNIKVTGNVKAEIVAGKYVGLYWSQCTSNVSPPAGSHLEYTIVRKDDAIPASAQDGQVLATVGAIAFEDTNIVPGQVYGYAVFPCLKGIVYAKGMFSTKVMTTSSVANLKAEPNTGAIHLSWKLPIKACGVKLYRKDGLHISTPSEGTPLDVLAVSNGYVDSGLQNDKPYSYLIVPFFTDANGKICEGVPLSVTSVPRDLPQPVHYVQQKTQGGNTFFAWQPIKGFSVKLYLTSQPIGPVGQTIATTDGLLAQAVEITESDSNRGRAVYRKKISGIQYLTPVTFSPYIGVIGQFIRLTQIEGISKVQILRSNGTIRLLWNWNEKCDEVIVLYRQDTYPLSPQDQHAKRETITRELYEYENSHSIHSAGEDNYFISLYNCQRIGSEVLYSTPYHVPSIGQNGITFLNYNFFTKRQYFFFGEIQYWIHIQTDGPCTIPDLVLLKKNRTQPLRKSDGMLVQRIPASNKWSLDVEIQGGQLTSDSCLKLFTEHDTQSMLYTINHPSSDNMRIIR